MSIAQNFPEIKPSLNLDFANVKKLDPRITFARASTGTYYDGQTVAKAEENFFVKSEDFADVIGGWAAFGATITLNTTSAPNGTTTGDTVTATAGTSIKRINQAIQNLSGTVVFSVYLKAGTHNFVQLLNDGDAQAFANFDITSSAGVVGTTGTKTTSSIIDAGNGWYRCVAVFNSTVVYGTSYRIALVPSASATYAQSLVALGAETIIVWGAQLEQRSSVTAYTPTTTQPITNYIPVLQTASANTARFDHDPVTSESLGLLVEEQRTNLLTYSEQFDNAAWTKNSSSVTANQLIAPDGTLTIDKLETSTNGFIERVVTVGSLVPHTYSQYFKKGSVSSVNLQGFDTAYWARATFNLSDGTITSVQDGTAKIEDVGNGVYRCSVTGTPNALSTTIYAVPATAGNIYIWGAQLEAGAFPTSYIKTEASQVTRSADSASMTGTNFSSWYRQDEGTLYADFVPTNISSTAQTAFLITDRDPALNLFGTAIGQNLGGIGGQASSFWVRENAANQALLFTANNVLNVGAPYKIAGAYQLNNFAQSTNSATPLTDTSGIVSTNMDRMFIGKFISNVGFSTHIRKIAYYPKRLTNEQLQALTS